MLQADVGQHNTGSLEKNLVILTIWSPLLRLRVVWSILQAGIASTGFPIMVIQVNFKLTHCRDLAARNVLMTELWVAKVINCLFELTSRQLNR